MPLQRPYGSAGLHGTAYVQLPGRKVPCGSALAAPAATQVGQDAYEATAGTLSTYELSGHTDTVVTVRFNASGTLLASAGMDGE